MAVKFDRTKLKALREAHGLSQYEFGRMIGLPPQLISAYERGRMKPRVMTLIKIINVFKLPGDYFFVVEMSHSGK